MTFFLIWFKLCGIVRMPKMSKTFATNRKVIRTPNCQNRKTWKIEFTGSVSGYCTRAASVVEVIPQGSLPSISRSNLFHLPRRGEKEKQRITSWIQCLSASLPTTKAIHLSSDWAKETNNCIQLKYISRWHSM